MVIEQIPVSQLNVKDSRFNIFRHLQSEQSETLSLSLKQSGLLCPLLVYKSDTNKCEIIDGFKRYQFASVKSLNTLPCLVLSKNTAPVELAALTLQKYSREIQKSAIRKSLFLRFCSQLRLASEEIDPLLGKLNIENHPRVIRQYSSIAELSDQVLQFCDMKNFSLKQCLHLSKHPPQLLDKLFQWQNLLHFTAATLEELVENLRDILRQENISMGDIENDEQFKAIMQSKENNQLRTQALRQWLCKRRYPRLSHIQEQLEKTARAMKLPKEIQVEWDKVLENRYLSIHAKITHPDQWPKLCEALNKRTTQEGIDELMEML